MVVTATTVKTARKRLKDLVRRVNDDTVAIEIAGKNANAVLISAARYRTLQEATFLLRSPELMDSLRRRAAAESLRESTPTLAVDPATRPRKSKKAGKKRKRKLRAAKRR